jgi:hypothetical protein
MVPYGHPAHEQTWTPLKNIVSAIQYIGTHPWRRITNPPQVTNLPRVDPTFFITVGGPQDHGDRSEICPTWP